MEKTIAARNLMGKLSLIALIIAFAGICDGLLASFRTPENRFDIISGNSAEIIGTFYGNAKNPGDLGFTSDTPGVTIDFDRELFKGFWLGDNMWRGHIRINPDLKQATARVKITFKDLSGIKPSALPKLEKRLIYTVRVFEDERAMRRHDLSAVTRILGLSPWVLPVASLPVIILSAIAGFFLSGKIEENMARNGKAEIFRVSRQDDNRLEIHFGMGKKHGLDTGERLMLFNKAGLLVTEIFVTTVNPESATAFAEPTLPVTPGYLVSRV